MNDLDIAIIGMSCRFPEANSIDEFWTNLKNGCECIKFFNDEELIKQGIKKEVLSNTNYVKANGVFDNIEYFDADFFKYSHKEATIMDPQIRVLHECCWEAMEDAGYDVKRYKQRVGLFLGVSPNVYWQVLAHSALEDTGSEQFNVSMLSDKDYGASKISYSLNLTGPSLIIDTACSSSLVTIHQACQSLLSGECEMAMAGGASIDFPQKKGYMYQDGFILSPDGHCKAFDNRANGTVGGNGAGIVVLKPLNDAILDGDHIYAVIKGSAINNDGSRKVGYTAPSIDGQMEAIEIAHHITEISPETIQYIEAHGTGTSLGDPIEIQALKAAFNTNKKGFCAIGSVKTNIGHLDRTAGVAGFIKTALALKYKLIPPTLNFILPNRNIDFEDSPFYINNYLKYWDKYEYPRRAAINSLGMGGTNAYVVLEEAPLNLKKENLKKENLKKCNILIISGKDKNAIHDICGNLVDYLKKNPLTNLSNLAYTLQVGRMQLPVRKALICRDNNDAIRRLSNHGEIIKKVDDSRNIRECSAVILCGQWEKSIGYGIELYKKNDVFYEKMNKCFEFIEKYYSDDLKENFIRENINILDIEKYILTFAMEYSLVSVLSSLGVNMDTIVGVGTGEYVVAHLSGVLSLEDCIRLVIKEAQVVFSIIQNEELLLRTKPFNNSMESFEKELSEVKLNKSIRPYLSSRMGKYVTGEEVLNKDYWIKNINNTKYYEKVIENLIQQSKDLFIEIGLNYVITNEIKKYKNENKVISFVYDNNNMYSKFLYFLGELWTEGIAINWEQLYSNEEKQRISIPTYPFQRKKYMLEKNPYEILINKKFKNNSLDEKEYNVKKWFYYPSWKYKKLQYTKQKEKSEMLIFSDDIGVGKELIKSIEHLSYEYKIVNINNNFDVKDNNHYYIRHSSLEDMERLIKHIVSTEHLPDKVVFLWTLEKCDNNIKSKANFNEMQKNGLYTLLYFICMMDKYASNHTFTITAVTNNSVGVNDEELIFPENCTIQGFLKVVSQEYVNINCSIIDIVINDKQLIKMGDTLLNEIVSNNREFIVAYRKNKRWIQMYEPYFLEATKKTSIIKKGVYLITGGLGNLGLIFSKYLATNYQARLILIGRFNFPQRDQWDSWILNKGSENSISIKINQIKEMEKLGAEISVFSADVSNAKQMEDVVLEVEKKYELINGVIHAAGITDENCLISELNTEVFERQFLSKVYGTMILDELFKNRNLDFCMLVSSLSPIVGGIGMAAYASANAFLDGYAQYHNLNRLVPWMVINWDGWNFDGYLENDNNYKQKHLDISKDEGIEALHVAFSYMEEEQLLISTRNLMLRYEKWILDRIDLARNRAENNNLEGFKERPNLLTDYLPPKGNIEVELMKIWRKQLGYSKIGAMDDFFELGGDSLKAINTISAIQKSFKKKITLSKFMGSPTIKSLAECLNQSSEINNSSIVPTTYKEVYNLSNAQKRIYVANQIDKDSTSYNIPLILKIEGKINLKKLEDAFKTIIKRHDSLRTSFVKVDNAPYQKIYHDVDFNIQRDALNVDIEDEQVSKVINKFIRPFNLEEPPLIRVLVLTAINNKSLMVIDINHIISDGVTLSILIKELLEFYSGRRLPEVKFQYKDYVEWQESEAFKERLNEQEKYWLNQFSSDIPLLSLHTDYKRPEVITFKGDQIIFQLNEFMTLGLKNCALKHNVTMFMLLLSMLNVLFSKLSSCEDIIIGTPVAGRTEPEFEGIMGLFLNYLPLRNKPSKHIKFSTFLENVKNQTIEAFENQEYPFDYLLEKLKISRDLSRNPLYDVLFIYQNVHLPKVELNDFNLEQHYFKNKASKLDLKIEAFEEGKNMIFIFEYNTSLFKPDTIIVFYNYFIEIIKTIINNSEKTIESIINTPNNDKSLLKFNDDLEFE